LRNGSRSTWVGLKRFLGAGAPNPTVEAAAAAHHHHGADRVDAPDDGPIRCQQHQAVHRHDGDYQGFRDHAALTAFLVTSDYPAPHPLVALFPFPRQPDLTGRTRADAVLEPIVVCAGQIVDSIADCLSAIALGIAWDDLPKMEFRGDEAAVLRFLVERMKQRQLKPGQRAMVAAGLVTMRQGERTDRPHIAQKCAKSQAQAGQLCGVSRRLVQEAARVRKRGVRELVQAVADGVVAITPAYRAAQLPADRQRALLAQALAQPNPARAFSAAVSASARRRPRRPRPPRWFSYILGRIAATAPPRTAL
jgi:hypothetical protein